MYCCVPLLLVTELLRARARHGCIGIVFWAWPPFSTVVSSSLVSHRLIMRRLPIARGTRRSISTRSPGKLGLSTLCTDVTNLLTCHTPCPTDRPTDLLYLYIQYSM
ncbi:hypothetical protein F4859DRAFT_359288 [Xylaria cf. heliscus]|nr:hypothetical protein F4859DRAFT_359288 [Xylaria cf. heliscus]